MSGDTLLRAGLAPVDGDAGQSVSARTYHHPGLAAPVIRLTGDRTALAEDRTMEFLGYGEPEVSEPLSRIAIQGLNYPSWALVHDADNAALALSTLPELDKAAKKAVTSPNAALEIFESIAKRLPHSHLASFWEQAGRLYLGADRAYYAGRMFTKARDAETIYALPVEESLRQAVFIEFALAGAVTVKVLSAYLDELKSRYTPDEAFAAFEKVVLGRIRGGQPPWTTLMDQWRALALSAGRDPEVETQRLLAALIDAPSVRSAPVKFWTLAAPSLIKLGQSSSEHRQTMLWLFPKRNSYELAEHVEFLGVWLDLLDKMGALRQLIDSGDTAPWLNHALGVLRGRRATYAPVQLLALLPELKSSCGIIDLSGRSDSWVDRYVNVDVLVECLRLGIPVAGPVGSPELNLTSWLENTTLPDLAPLATDVRWQRLLYSTLDRLASSNLITDPKLAPVLDGWLVEHARSARDGGILDLGRSMPLLRSVDVRSYPDALAEIQAIDPVAVLQRSLRAGLANELHWPAYQDAMEELSEGKGRVNFVPSWPYLTLFNDQRAIVVGPEGRIAEHNPQWPSGSKRYNTVVYVDGQLLVTWSVSYGESNFYWSSDPSAVRSGDVSWLASQDGARGYSMLTKDGARLSNNDILRVGDTEPNYAVDLLSDGNGFWYVESKASMFGINPANGTVVEGANVPAFLAAPLDGGQVYDFKLCSLAPMDVASPLGWVDGLAGTRVSSDDVTYRVETIDGRVMTVPRRHQHGPWALMTFPARSEPVVLDGASGPTIVDADGHRHSVGHVQTTTLPPTAFWHFLTTRDEKASRILAELSEKSAAALVEAGVSDNAITRAETDEVTYPACAAVLDELGVVDPIIRDSVVSMSLAAAHAQRGIDKLLSEEEPPVVLVDCGIDHDALASALQGVVNLGWRSGGCTVADQIIVVDAFLRGDLELAIAEAQSNEWGYLLRDLIEQVPMLALRATSSVFSEAERVAVKDLLGVLSRSILMSGDVQSGVAKAESLTHLCDGNGALYITSKDWIDGVEYHHKYLVVGEPAAPFVINPTPILKGWTTLERLNAIMENLGSADVVEIPDEAIEVWCSRTGLPRSIGALLLGGFPQSATYGRGYLDREARAALRLTVAESELAEMWLRRFNIDKVRKLYVDAVSIDLDILWDANRRAEVLADAWVARFGTYPRLSDEDIVAARSAIQDYWLMDVMLFLADPKNRTQGAIVGENGIDLVRKVTHWASCSLPEGHPLRANVPAAIAAIRNHIEQQGFLNLGRVSRHMVPPELVATRPVKVEGLNEEAHDLGALLLTPSGDYWYNVKIRYDQLIGDAHEALIRTYDTRQNIENREWLFSAEPDAVAARSGAIPAGRYDTDPTVSASELVSQVAEHLAIDSDAAALYLQLLALPNATDKNVRLWNDWKPKRHKAAVAVLLERHLVIEAKRTRAGRSVFLPGGWDAKTLPYPYETWKSDMYQNSGDAVLHAPCPQLFAHAWDRVVSGEGPR